VRELAAKNRELLRAYIIAQAKRPGARQRSLRPGVNSSQEDGLQQTTPTRAPGP
jgi:hypothetical protein